MKWISLLAVALMMVSCSSKDEQFCECLELSEQLTQASRAALIANPTQADIEKIDSIKQIKLQRCEQYEVMGGEELLKKRNDCGWKE